MKRNWGDLGLYYERTYIYVSLIELDFFVKKINERGSKRDVKKLTLGATNGNFHFFRHVIQ